MLTDSSLTNIFLVSGVSQIRFRVYSQQCKRSQLADFLKAGTSPNSQWNQKDDSDTHHLIRASRNLLQLRIPCTWRVAPESVPVQDDDEVTLELWVFWFEDRFTGKIDDNVYLQSLEEIDMGSFTWETAIAKSLSPTASPRTPSTGTSSSVFSVSLPYKLFIKSIKNLIRGSMLQKEALPLGEFFIFPSTFTHADAYSEILAAPPDPSVSTLLTCTYNIYLTNTNLVVQPDVRRLRIRPLKAHDLDTVGTSVITCPSGEQATIIRTKQDIPHQLEEHTLHHWSSLLDIPIPRHHHHHNSNTSNSKHHLPSLVPLRMSNNNIVLYPTALTFISTSVPVSPVSTGGMNGVLGYTQGYTEDLGEKWSRWAWSDQIKEYARRNRPEYNPKNQDDFWVYGSPKMSAASAILDTLSIAEMTNFQGVLQKALSEPVGSSPIMVSKAVATPASSGPKMEPNDPTETTDKRAERFQHQSELSVADFAKLHFGDDEDEDVAVVEGDVHVKEDDYVPTADTPAEGFNAQQTNGHDITSSIPVIQQETQESATPVNSAALTDSSVLLSSVAMVLPEASGNYQSSTSSPPIAASDDAFGFRFNIDDNNLYGVSSNRWGDPMEDLDNFDLNVTEEDFNFFENEPVKQEPAPAPIFENTTASVKQEVEIPEPQQNGDDDLMLLGLQPNEEINLDELFSKDNFLDNSLLIDTTTDPIKLESDSLVPQTISDDLPTATPAAEPLTHDDEIQKPIASSPGFIDTKAEQRFVPPEFAPIKFAEGVNDAKYSDGGKFMYMPTPQDEDDKRQLKRKAKLKRDGYRPDYVPRLRKRPRIKDTHRSPVMRPAASLFMYRASPVPTTTPPVTVVDNGKTDNASISSEEEDDDSDTSSSATSSSDDSSFSGSQGSYEPDLWMATMHSTQSIFISQLLKKSPMREALRVNDMRFEFDSPFPSTTAYGSIIPRQLKDADTSQEDLKVLDYLCQQVVMGGYPFTSGLTSISANGGEVPRDESPAVLVARRRGLIQRCQGDVTHVPSLGNDYDKVAQEFRNVLVDLFDYKVDTDSNNVDQMSIPSMPSTVAVKGPLSVQQYYDLSETSQAQTKYGKYQVKKRRPAEPNLDTLSPPDIVVGRQDEFLEGSPKLVTFWEKLRLEPYSSRKNIRYFVVFPSNEQLESICTQFFKSLSTVYETCHLGGHQSGSIGNYRRGLVPVPLLPESEDESWVDRQLRSYSAECQNLGSALGGAMVENMHIVIYIVNPTHDLSSNLELSRCFHKLMIAYHAASMGMSTRQERRARIVFQLVPLEHVLRSSTFGGYTNFGLKDIAFSVYSKCHTVIGRNHTQSGMEDTRSAAVMYSPPFVLAKSIPDAIQYSLKNSTNTFPVIMDQNATLHMAYCFSLDRHWMIIVWTDNQGELLEFSVIHVKGKPLSRAIDEAWRRTKEVAQRTGFQWTFVLAKIGLMFEDEMQAWIDFIPADDKVAIVCVDIDSALRVHISTDQHQHQQQVPVMDYPQTPGSSANTPTPETFSTPTSTTIPNVSSTATIRPMDAATDSTGETKALLLNHRVAYSKRRTQVTEGTVFDDNSEADERWMLPLATGYLIYSTAKTENPCREQFNNEPLVMDVHLVYNQTAHSAYSTLRDIIKRYHALSFVSMTPSSGSCLPLHLVLAERLVRILLIVEVS
ncbi:mediator complex subunit 13 C-terminal-domain-containing protein [Fennellomyces sp. T-0311]|nr:mediator complex subunit 13 C-terminal-domain-containing protein [Fennellomyces sp. T-0311]